MLEMLGTIPTQTESDQGVGAGIPPQPELITIGRVEEQPKLSVAVTT